MFKLKQPCKECPFLKDTPTKLHPTRFKSIIQSLLNNESFHCHKTVDYSDSDGSITEESQMCAGAMIYLEKLHAPNQMMRIAERLGNYDRTKLTGFDNVID